MRYHHIIFQINNSPFDNGARENKRFPLRRFVLKIHIFFRSHSISGDLVVQKLKFKTHCATHVMYTQHYYIRSDHVYRYDCGVLWIEIQHIEEVHTVYYLFFCSFINWIIFYRNILPNDLILSFKIVNQLLFDISNSFSWCAI